MTKKEQTEQENLTPQELKAQADAILAADQAEKEQREKARNTPLDEKTIATLPAAALITANEKLRDLLAKGKKKGKKARKKAAKRARKRATERQIALANYRCGYLSAENDMLRKMIALSVGVKRGSFNDKLAADGLKLLPGGDR